MMSFKSLKKVSVIGLMSGTSLDGLDLCFVEFLNENGAWSFQVKATKGVSYSAEWRSRLEGAFIASDKDLKKLHLEYGEFLGDETVRFIAENELFNAVDLIASHGHTVFHEPSKGITVQIGDGASIAKKTNLPVVNDFRIKDVQLGGQGAPLVPVGDAQLFSQYDACLNLGGISNISFEQNKKRIAFDIAPCNLPLNKLMREYRGKEYDEYGRIAEGGAVIPALLTTLNQLDFYKLNPPKSLAIEWLNKAFYPVLTPYLKDSGAFANILHTIVVHEATQIANVINETNLKTVLITGGGAYNGFFIKTLNEKSKARIIIPTDEIIEFKEALIFAFLGLLNVRGEVNTYKTVTGASSDSIGGILTFP